MGEHRHYQCPQCRQPVTWDGNLDRPFCSERCRLLDLGAWIDGGYRIAAETAGTEATDEETK